MSFLQRVKKLEAVVKERHKEDNSWREDEDNFLHTCGMTDEELSQCKTGDEAFFQALDKLCVFCGIAE